MVKFLTSYRNKLIATFIVISVLPILLVGYSMNIKIKDKVVNEGINSKKYFIEDGIDKIEMWFYEKEQILKSISNNYSLIKTMISSGNSGKNVDRYLQSNTDKASGNSFLNTFITMTSGENFNSKYKDVNFDTRKQNWYINAYIKKDISWSQPYEDLLTGRTVITVSIPLFNKDGDIEGVLGADLDFDKVKERFNDIKVDDNSTTYIVTPQGKMYNVLGKKISYLEEYNPKHKAAKDNLVKELNYDGIDTINHELEEKYFGIYGSISNLGWRVISLTREEAFYESLTRINTLMGYAIFLTAIFVFLAAIFFSRLLSKSFDKLMQGTLEIQKGNYDHKIPVEGSDEFAHLAMAFNNMTLKLKDSYNSIKNNSIEILKSNKKLKDINEELEASYKKLKATSEELNNSRTQYKNLIDNMHDIVWVLDKDFNLIFLNERLEDILDYKIEEVIGKNLKDLIDIWEDVSEERLERLKINDYKNTLVTHKTKDGSEKILELNTKRLFNDGELVAIQGLARDVTERINMEDEILRRNTELVIINKIGTNLNSTMDLDKLLKITVDDIVKLLDIPLCTIRLLTSDDKLELMTYGGELSNCVSEKYIPLEDDLMGKVVETAEVIILDTKDRNNISRYNKKVINNNQVGFVNMFPLKVRGKVLGVLLVATKDNIKKSNLNIISSLSNQIAMIIENIELYRGVKDGYMNTIRALTATVEAKDKYTEGHSLRVSKYSRIIANKIGLPKEVCEEIEVAGILHDIGKIGINDDILTKDGKLTDEEFKMIENHPVIGGKILEDAGFSNTVMNCIKYHHLKYDLSGYPRNSGLFELPVEASIIGVADAFDAMTSNRSYRRAMSFEKAISELLKYRGSQFDPRIVDIIVDIYKNEIILLENIAVTNDLAS